MFWVRANQHHFDAFKFKSEDKCYCFLVHRLGSCRFEIIPIFDCEYAKILQKSCKEKIYDLKTRKFEDKPK